MAITGNVELSRDVLHKNINFISPDTENKELQSPTTVYQGRNYSISLVRQMNKRGLKFV